jgi:hypothetical protein
VFAGLGVGGSALAQSGSFQQSCRNTRSANGLLTAECADRGGAYHQSTLPFGQCRGDISNNNGMLTCNGAVASGGGIVGGGPRGAANSYNVDKDRRDNNGNFGAGVFAGALLGGALAGNAPGLWRPALWRPPLRLALPAGRLWLWPPSGRVGSHRRTRRLAEPPDRQPAARRPHRLPRRPRLSPPTRRNPVPRT